MSLSGNTHPQRWLLLLIAFAAACVLIPQMLHGVVCGDDFAYHIQSWLGAADQMRHGQLYPQWIAHPSYNAGEPRFIFYPPLSWMLGAAAYLLFPSTHFVLIFLFVVLAGAGLAAYSLARLYAPPAVAVLCACLYTVNPYMLLDVLQRSAFGEVLCAIWAPLLLRALLQRRPTITGIAIPLALTWLSNVPLTVASFYFLGIFGVLRLFVVRPGPGDPLSFSSVRAELSKLWFPAVGGAVLGTLLSGVYLIPAFFERHMVQTEQAFAFDVGVTYLFQSANHRRDRISILMLVCLVLTGGAVYLALRATGRKHLPGGLNASPAGACCRGALPADRAAVLLATLAVLIAIDLTPLTTPLWHLPGLHYLQFRWRLGTLLMADAAVALALGVAGSRLRVGYASAMTVVLTLLMGLPVAAYFEKQRAHPNFDRWLVEFNKAGKGGWVTYEITPVGASNSDLRINSPGYWLSENSASYARGTIHAVLPPAFDIPYQLDHLPPLSTQIAPRHLLVTLPKPEVLILNLRNYHNWEVMRDQRERLPILFRPDGLIAVPLPAGASTIDVLWHRSLDDVIGDCVSVLGLILLGLAFGVQLRGCSTFERPCPSPAD